MNTVRFGTVMQFTFNGFDASKAKAKPEETPGTKLISSTVQAKIAKIRGEAEETKPVELSPDTFVSALEREMGGKVAFTSETEGNQLWVFTDTADWQNLSRYNEIQAVKQAFAFFKEHGLLKEEPARLVESSLDALKRGVSHLSLLT